MRTPDKPKTQPAQCPPGNCVFLAYVYMSYLCPYFPRPPKSIVEEAGGESFPAVFRVYKAVKDGPGNYGFGPDIKVGDEVPSPFNNEKVLLGGVVGSFQVLTDGLWWEDISIRWRRYRLFSFQADKAIKIRGTIISDDVV